MDINLTDEEKQIIEEKVAKVKTEFLSTSEHQIAILDCAGKLYEYCVQKNYPIPSKEKLVELVVRLAAIHGQTFDYIESEIKRIIDSGKDAQ